MRRLIFALLTTLAAPLVLADEPLAAHEHGVARLDIASEAGVVELVLNAPAESIVGFEHVPQTAHEQHLLEQALKAFNRPQALFHAPSCDWQTVHIATDFAAGHGAINAHYRAHCAASRIDVAELFQRFKALSTVQVQRIDGQGQQALELTPAQPVLELH